MDRSAAGVMIAPPTGLKTEEELLGYYAWHRYGRRD
jgi:hypothetical protein